MSDKTKQAEALLKLNKIPAIDRTPLENAVLFSRHGEVGNAAIELLALRARVDELKHYAAALETVLQEKIEDEDNEIEHYRIAGVPTRHSDWYDRAAALLKDGQP